MKLISFTVNGTDVKVEISASDRLIDVLRDKLRLTGTKEGCGIGEC
ncbi:MAG: (2Fe-2S)-binding protein, partial [Bacillota bacterium]